MTFQAQIWLWQRRRSFGKGNTGLSLNPEGFPQKAKSGDHCTQGKNKAEAFLQKQVTGVLPISEDSFICQAGRAPGGSLPFVSKQHESHFLGTGLPWKSVFFICKHICSFFRNMSLAKKRPLTLPYACEYHTPITNCLAVFFFFFFFSSFAVNFGLT